MRASWRRPSLPPLSPLRTEVRVTDASHPAAEPLPESRRQGQHRDHVVARSGFVPKPRRLWADGDDLATPRPFSAGTITSIPSPPDPFEALVRAALDELPQQFLDTLEDVPVVISNNGAAFGAYGLYHGASIANPGLPASIYIFRDTLGAHFGHDPRQLAEQVRRVVRHELGHHLGFDEDGVARLGL